MPIQFEDAVPSDTQDEKPLTVKKGPDQEVSSRPSEQAPSPASDPLFHSHDPEGRYGHSHDGGDSPHVGHAEDGSPVFEGETSEVEDDCPSESHLHVVANRRLSSYVLAIPFGPFIPGKDPWNVSSHCPKCGKLVQDRNSRRFRCDSEGCDAQWEIPKDQMKAAREAASRAAIGEEFVMLTPVGA